MHSLDEIEAALLSYTSLRTEQVPADSQHPFSELLVHLSETLALRVFRANQVLEAGSEEVSSVFCFLLRSSEQVAPELQHELQRLLGVLNHLLPLGSLELNEDGLFFRHTLLSEEPSLDGLLALEIVLGIEALLPPIFVWIHEVLAQAGPGEMQEHLRQRFRQLLEQAPVFQPLALPPPPAAVPRPGPIPMRALHLGAAALGSLVALVVTLTLGPLWGLLLGLSLGTGALGLARLYLRRWNRSQDRREQQRQLRFYWQLLEVESIKLAYQDQALSQQQQQIESKLAELSGHPVAYPSDILRLRQQMLALRQLQSRLGQRASQLGQRRQELEQSRFQLLRERLSLMPEAGPVAGELSGQVASSEDMLMQNLMVTLEYLDFQVRAFTQGGAPVLEVIPHPNAPSISLRWLQRWHLAPRPPEHTWMLCFDLTLPVTIPEQAWPRVQELLRVFKRFLPLGTLLCDYSRQRITLRYRFLRLRGDLSTLLVMEILEVMASFGERLQQRLLECLDQDKHLSTILDETEKDLQTMAT